MIYPVFSYQEMCAPGCGCWDSFGCDEHDESDEVMEDEDE